MEVITDKKELLEAVKENGLALKYASESLKNDKEIVLEAVKKDSRASMYMSCRLANDKEFFASVKKYL